MPWFLFFSFFLNVRCGLIWRTFSSKKRQLKAVENSLSERQTPFLIDFLKKSALRGTYTQKQDK